MLKLYTCIDSENHHLVTSMIWNKNVTNLHIWQWKKIVLHALNVQFLYFGRFVHFLVLSTGWNDLFYSGQRQHVTTNFWFLLFPSLRRLHQVNSRIVSKQFASQTDRNNWGRITEIRSYIFRWSPLCRRLRGS